MKICVINALKFVTFDFLKKIFSKFRILKECLGDIVNKTLKIIATNKF